MLHSWLQGCTWESWFETRPLSASSSCLSPGEEAPSRWLSLALGGHVRSGSPARSPALPSIPHPARLPKTKGLQLSVHSPVPSPWADAKGHPSSGPICFLLASPAPSSASLTPTCDYMELTSASSSAQTPKKSLPVLCLHYPTWGYSTCWWDVCNSQLLQRIPLNLELSAFL